MLTGERPLAIVSVRHDRNGVGQSRGRTGNPTSELGANTWTSETHTGWCFGVADQSPLGCCFLPRCCGSPGAFTVVGSVGELSGRTVMPIVLRVKSRHHRYAVPWTKRCAGKGCLGFIPDEYTLCDSCLVGRFGFSTTHDSLDHLCSTELVPLDEVVRVLRTLARETVVELGPTPRPLQRPIRAEIVIATPNHPTLAQPERS